MTIAQAALEQLFLNARTANGFLDKPVPLSLVQQVYDIATVVQQGRGVLLTYGN